MAKKFKIDIDLKQDNCLLGISCHKKDYWLAFNINDILKLKLSRIADLPVYDSKLDIPLKYSLFYFKEPNTLISYYLLSNYNPEGKLFPTQKTIDYFILINGRTEDTFKTDIARKIKQIPNVLTAFEIEISGIKNIENFLSDLELHMLDLTKKKQ